MLDYLLHVIEENVLFIFVIILVFAAASQFSKKIKIFFYTCVGLVTTYFALLCLYKLGIGSEKLYDFAAKYVYILSLGFEKIAGCLFQNDFSSLRLFQGLVLGDLNLVGIVFSITISLSILYLVILNISRVKQITKYQSENNIQQQANYKISFCSSIPYYVLNDVFRC